MANNKPKKHNEVASKSMCLTLNPTQRTTTQNLDPDIDHFWYGIQESKLKYSVKFWGWERGGESATGFFDLESVYRVEFKKYVICAKYGSCMIQAGCTYTQSS